MCAGKFQILLLSISAAVISADSLSAEDKATVSMASARSETDSISAANIPLPQNSPVAAQKPTSAAPANSSVIRLDWAIDAADSTRGSRKPDLNKSPSVIVPSNSRPVPKTTIVSRPTQKPESKMLTAAPVRNGFQKPTLATVPPASEITQVHWTAESGSSNSSKTIESRPDFKTDCCPFVLWNPDAPGELCPDEIIDRAPIGSCSDLVGTVVERTASRIFPASFTPEVSGGPDPADLAELKQLQPQSHLADFSSGSYLSDLNQLLQGESSWIFGNEHLLDLAPNEGNASSVGYMEDLNALVRSQTRPASAQNRYLRTFTAQESSQEEFSVPQRRIPGEPYDIHPDPVCDVVGGHGVGSLFQPMSSIQVAGLSTAPPEKPRNPKADESTELRRPDNAACAYMENATPAYYFPPTRYGVCRPSRNTHTLYHNPLYYEDPNLERCGQGHGCLTNAVSAVHFGTAIAFTPYLTGATCPNTCVRALPDCPTCHSFGHDAYCPGWSWKGAAAQAAAVTGLYFVIP